MGNILFLAHRFPWPPNRGDKIRSYHFLKKLMEVAPVHLACFADDLEEAEKGDPLKAIHSNKNWRLLRPLCVINRNGRPV